MRKKTSRKKLEDQLDKAWSEYIHRRDRVCQKCGGSSLLSAHHAFGRVHRATRWDVMNGLLLCYPHHRYFAHGDPCGFREWFKDHIGHEHYDRLAEAHTSIVKHTIDDLEQMLITLNSL